MKPEEIESKVRVCNGKIYHFERRLIENGYPDLGYEAEEYNRYERRSNWIAQLLLGSIRYELIGNREVRQSI